MFPPLLQIYGGYIADWTVQYGICAALVAPLDWSAAESTRGDWLLLSIGRRGTAKCLNTK